MSDAFDTEDIDVGAGELLRIDCGDYLTGRGFTERETNLCVHTALELYNSLDENSQLTDLLTFLERLVIDLQTKLTLRCCTIFTEYLQTTLLQHFSLYKHARTNPREILKKVVIEDVETLETPPVFSTGIPYKIWSYEHKIDEIEKDRRKEQEERTEEVLQLKTDRKDAIKRIRNLVLPDDEELTLRERVREMIQQSVGTQTELLSKMLSHELDATQEALQRDIEKAIVPRPASLGQLPMRPVPSRGASREVRDLHSSLASRINTTQETARKSAGKSRGGKKP